MSPPQDEERQALREHYGARSDADAMTVARLLAETERLRAALGTVREYLRDPALPNDRDDMRRVIDAALRGVPPGQQDGQT